MRSVKPTVKANPITGKEIFPEKALPPTRTTQPGLNAKHDLKNPPKSSQVPPLDLSSLNHSIDEQEDGNGSPIFIEVKVKTPPSCFSMDSAKDTVVVNNNKEKYTRDSKNKQTQEASKIFEHQKDEGDELLEMMMKEWTIAPHTRAELKRINDKNELEERNKELRIIEAVMTDQLCRSTISSPIQIFGSQKFQQGQSKGFRSLHNSRLNVSSCNTEESLSHFTKFETRMFTDIGKDAMRDLFGFYFAIDGSLTIYEVKTFGKSSKSLPFIKRDIYTHLSGPRTGEPYKLTDITEEGEMEFRTVHQPLPDSLLQQKSIKLIIGRVDVKAKKKILLQNVDQYKHDVVWNDLHCPKNQMEEKLLEMQHQMRADAKKQWKNMGIKQYIRASHRFRDMIKAHGKDMLDIHTLGRMLSEAGITIPQEKFKDYVVTLNACGTNFMSYLEFLRYFLGEMSEQRKRLVRKAFAKINKDGSTNQKEMTKYFNASAHPWVKSGFRESQQIAQLFLCTFNDDKSENIPYRSFEEFYESLSLIIDSDNDFENILKNSWNV